MPTVWETGNNPSRRKKNKDSPCIARLSRFSLSFSLSLPLSERSSSRSSCYCCRRGDDQALCVFAYYRRPCVLRTAPVSTVHDHLQSILVVESSVRNSRWACERERVSCVCVHLCVPRECYRYYSFFGLSYVLLSSPRRAHPFRGEVIPI